MSELRAAIPGLPAGPLRLCITDRTLLTGTADYTPAVRALLLRRLAVIAERRAADAVILREKDLSPAAYAGLAEEALALCREKGLPLILHRFTDIACRLRPVPPLHLGMADFLSFCGRRDAGTLPGGIPPVTGVSTHTVEEARRAEQLGAAYITASHIFPTSCKPGLPPRGIGYLREVCEAVSIPVFALGGVHPAQIGTCLAAGAAGVCMMSEYFRPDFAEEEQQ